MRLDKLSFVILCERGHVIKSELRESTEINGKKFKKNAFIFIARDVFVELITVASYIHESDSSICVLPQTHMIKCREL